MLGKVIAALVEARSHVPYPAKLTTLLRAALGGASRDRAHLLPARRRARRRAAAGAAPPRCALVSNVAQTIAARSARDALRAVDATLAECEQAAAPAARGKTKLPAYRALADRIEQMKQRAARSPTSRAAGDPTGARRGRRAVRLERRGTRGTRKGARGPRTGGASVTLCLGVRAGAF